MAISSVVLRQFNLYCGVGLSDTSHAVRTDLRLGYRYSGVQHFELSLVSTAVKKILKYSLFLIFDLH